MFFPNDGSFLTKGYTIGFNTRMTKITWMIWVPPVRETLKSKMENVVVISKCGTSWNMVMFLNLHLDGTFRKKLCNKWIKSVGSSLVLDFKVKLGLPVHGLFVHGPIDDFWIFLGAKMDDPILNWTIDDFWQLKMDDYNRFLSSIRFRYKLVIGRLC